MTVILFDKMANREEYEYSGSTTDQISIEKTINEVEYTITYDYQFLDKKMRPVFVESKRVSKTESENV